MSRPLVQTFISHPHRRGNLVAHMNQKSPEEARRQIMIGDKQECLDTIARYRKAGISHFIFMIFAPYFLDEIQGFAEEVMPAVQ